MATREGGIAEPGTGIAEIVALTVVLVLAYFLFSSLGSDGLDADLPPIAMEIYPDIRSVQ